MEESVLAQGLINLPAPYLGIGTYAILPMKSMHSQHYKAVKPEKENEGRLYSLFQSKETTYFGSYFNQHWNSICLLKKSENLEIFLNGEEKSLPTTTFNPSKDNLEVMGYYVYNDWKPLVGSMTDFNIWKRVLQETEIRDFDNCDLDDETDQILKWKSAIVNATEVEEIQTDKDIICSDNQKSIYLSSGKKVNFDDTLEYCLDVTGGEIAVIDDEESTSRAKEALSSIPNWESQCFTKIWTGYTKDENEIFFRNPNNNKTGGNINWMDNEPKDLPGESCPMFDTVYNKSSNKECHHLKCPICRVSQNKKYILRGICKGETWLADTFYYLKQEKVFIGNLKTKITWSSERWELKALKDDATIAYLDGTNDYPFGKHKWYFTNSECKDPGKGFRTLLLHQEVDQPGKFCCDDGKCIDSQFVCDNNQHCDDNTDENNCNLILFSQDYDSKAPPSERIKKKRQLQFTDTKVNVDVYIYFMMEINEEDSSWTLLFTNKATWHDHRLDFTFLKEKRNPIKDNFTNLWLPKMGYAVELSEMINIAKDLTVVKNSKPKFYDGADQHHPQGNVISSMNNP